VDLASASFRSWASLSISIFSILLLSKTICHSRNSAHMYSLKHSKASAIILILNDLPASWRFMIGRSTTFGVHISILRSGCGYSPMGGGWGWSSFGLGGGHSLGDSDGPSTSAFESRVSNPLACVAHLLCM
jgi:hypothetical protein